MDSQKKQLISRPLGGMHIDAPPSLQPEGTYREAWGVVNSTDRESDFGISNEAANAIHTLLPAGYEIRGLAYAEERDQFVVFLYSRDSNKSEIGIIDERTKQYRTVVNDDKIPDGKLCFGDEFINIELKIEQPCNELHAYWSNDYTYRFINLESDCCDYTLADMTLFRCICGPIIDTTVQEGGGTLVNGAYQFVAQLEDGDGNKTNWFKVSQPEYIAGEDYIAGQPTRRSIRLDLTDLDPEYGQINIAVIKTIDGQTFPPEIVFRSNYGASKVTVIYNGQKGESIELSEVLVKNPSYIRGRNLAQKDGRLILYNILGETNLDYQKHANNIKVTYSVGLVPAEEAHLVQTVRRDENYLLGIRWNYCDGTSSADFIIPGRELTDEDREPVSETDAENCSACVKPRWAVYNTSQITWTSPEFNNPFSTSEKTSSLYKPNDKKVESSPEEYFEELEPTEIPDAFKDILDHDPDDMVGNICECLTELIKIQGVIAHEDGPYVVDLRLGMAEECCDRLQNNISTFGGGFANGLNDIIGSLGTDTPAPPGGGDETDPGLDCSQYICRLGSCPDGCDCDPGTFTCYKTSEATSTATGPEDFVPPSKTVTPLSASFIHDIELVDTSVTPHVIKDYLDAGKVVYLKIFTTWCSPCYTQHTSGVIDTFYTTYGPAGFDVAQVIGVEFDPTTDSTDLDGTGTKTQGDFTTASYPIVDASAELVSILAANYGIEYFPQIIAIYPDGTSETISEDQLAESAESLALVGTPGAPGCTSCGGGNSVGKCGGSGSCSDPVSYDSCYECEEDGYCRYVCYKQPSTFLQAVQNLLFHIIERRRKSSFYRHSGMFESESGVASSTVGGDLKYAKIRVYDDDGCDVIDKLYPIVSEGKLGAWQSSEIYPLTKDCNGEYLFGDLAGKPVRLHRIPDSSQEPHFLSYHDGVIHSGDLSAYELQDTFVRPIWLNFTGITFPTNLPKPLCPNNPFTITYVKRDPTNKRVLASGIFTHTFLGNVFGRDYVFPKHGVNSLEYVDRNIYNFVDNPPACDSDCWSSADCGPGCECIGAVPAGTTRYCQPPELPSCAGQYCDPAIGCGEGCDCLPSNPTADCNTDCSIGGGLCPDGCECYDPCVNTTCFNSSDCAQNCFCSFTNPDDPTGTCVTDTVLADLQCRNVHECYPILPCGSIPCNGDEECPEECPTCPPPEGTKGSCRPISVEKKGKPNDFPIYNFHSPDTSFDIPFLGGANKAVFDLNVFNWGWRHGLYALGEEPDTIWAQQIDQRGARQTVNLNHYNNIIGTRNKCVSGITYAPADSVIDAPEGFTVERETDAGKIVTVEAPLMNLYRESSVYVQFEGSYVNPLPKEVRADLLDTDASPYRTDDASFIGDGNCHNCVVPRAGAWYGSLIQDRKDQYGSVEGLRMIPFGVEGTMNDALRGRITGAAGDAFIGPWTLVRKSYVSNKVGDDLEEPVTNDLLRFFCWGDCSKLPKSCNSGDPKNRANLRPWIKRCPSFTGVFTRNSITDIYYPRTQKTLVVTWVEADSNTWYRESGETENFEVGYPRLRGIPLDSSMTERHYDECFINQFAVKHERIPKWKTYAKVVFRVLAFLGPILWFLNGGFAINDPYIDIFILILRVALFVTVLALAVFVIFTCTNLNRLLEIKQCRTDDQGGANEENTYGFRDNYARYNYDYSLPNDIDQGFSVTSAYDTRACLGEETNKVVYSDPQVVGSPINAWRNFRINNYLELPMDSGPIQEIFVLGDSLYIQTTDNMWNVYGNQAQLQVDGGRTVYIGQGDFMNRADAIFGGVVEGSAGTLDPNASVVSKYGHISIDREAHEVNLFAGNAVTPLSDVGLRHFLNENLRLILLEHYPDFVLVDRKSRYGVGFSIGIDHELDRILVTKIDYEPLDPSALTLTADGRAFIDAKGEHVLAGDPRYFCNKSFTASYSFRNKAWVSFHYYTPTWYAWNRFTLYTFNHLAMWEHNVLGKFQTFYDEFHPMVVEIVANDAYPFKYESTILDTESSRWSEIDYITGFKATFNELIAYNRHQSTGLVALVEQETQSILENSVEDFDRVALEYNLPRWNFSDLRDRVVNYKEFLFDKDCEIGPRLPNNNNIHSDITNNTFVDNYLVYQLRFSTFDDVKLLLKSVTTNIDIEER